MVVFVIQHERNYVIRNNLGLVWLDLVLFFYFLSVEKLAYVPLFIYIFSILLQ